MSAQRVFYATRNDLSTGLSHIEALLPVKYVLAGAWSQPTVLQYCSYVDIPGLGISENGDTSERHYLIMPRDMKVMVRKRKQRRGPLPYRFFVDAADHADVLTFFPGGVFGRNTLISGSAATGYNTRPAKQLYKTFARELTRGFTRVGVYHVGSEALIFLKNGWRLTPSISWAREADLPPASIHRGDEAL